eukprot:jgi/Mesen1/8089/ME000434S07336
MSVGPAKATGVLSLDTRDLSIKSAVDSAGNAVTYEVVTPSDPIKGSLLRLGLHDDQVTIASVEVPSDTKCVMSAAHMRSDTRGATCTHTFEMRQPIPPYLFALAAGDIASEYLSPRCRVYAEPSVVRAAAHEFAETERMIECAEALFGPYDWDRFDLVVMPPSFPYGGMENPRAAFLTPTLLVGDRSLVNVVAHELAHSWTGNLVTNATCNDFWLNELAVAMLLVLHARMGPSPPGPCLAQPCGDAFTMVGRPAFDEFIRKYIARFRFQSISTETFVAFLVSNLPHVEGTVDLDAWLHGEGLPPDAPEPKLALLEEIKGLAAQFSAGRDPTDADVAGWAATEWQIYVDALPKRISHAQIKGLDERFGLSKSLRSIGRMKYLRPLYAGLVAGGSKDFATKVFESAIETYHPLAQAVVKGVLKKSTTK